MPKAAKYLLIWRAERRTYELCEHPSQRLLTLAPGEHAWFDWLKTVRSFTFQGQQGHLTVRKESRQRGDQYWYAYRRVDQRLTKKYLGRTTDLTPARLEETAAYLLVSKHLLRMRLPLRGPPTKGCRQSSLPRERLPEMR